MAVVSDQDSTATQIAFAVFADKSAAQRDRLTRPIGAQITWGTSALNGRRSPSGHCANVCINPDARDPSECEDTTTKRDELATTDTLFDVGAPMVLYDETTAREFGRDESPQGVNFPHCNVTSGRPRVSLV